MSRATIIVWASLLFCAPSFPQLNRISGDIRYEHQYQEVQVHGTLLTALRRSPTLNLNTKGSFVSDNFIFYTLRTSLATSFRTTHSAGATVTSRQILWNEYDVDLFFFQIAPANFQLSSREYTTDFRSEYSGLRSRGGTRNHEDRMSFSLVRVPFLPLVNFSYQRNTSWSIIGEPYRNHSNQYTFSASSKNGTDGHATVTGSLSEFGEETSGFYERILNLHFDGSRNLAEGHQLSLGSEYYKFGGYSSVSGGAGYTGTFGPDVIGGSTVNAQRAGGLYYSARAVNGSQSVQWTQNENFQYGAVVSGGAGVTINSYTGVPRRIDHSAWNGAMNVNHTRSAGGLNVNNNLSFGYGRRRYIDVVDFYRIGLNNSLNRSVGSFALNATYNFSHLSNRNGYSWTTTEHYASLSATGRLPGAIRSRSNADFRSYVYGGAQMTASDQSSLNLSQGFDGSFKHVIPFSLSAGASVHYFFVGLRGHSYGWNAAFQSPRFFLANLYASYRYSRTYDPYYRRESLEHSAGFSYRWRLLSFQLTLRERRVFSTMRDVRFSVERSL